MDIEKFQKEKLFIQRSPSKFNIDLREASALSAHLPSDVDDDDETLNYITIL